MIPVLVGCGCLFGSAAPCLFGSAVCLRLWSLPVRCDHLLFGGCGLQSCSQSCLVRRLAGESVLSAEFADGCEAASRWAGSALLP